ncbi:hypothetical protein [Nocardioides sp. R-C-SC26]|uniref:hypothetical protein n=1 Tax=Nocardioides sp. R-C-SC26 TaxID=2870414 RepID=UPI001E2C5142|nr:hypothetical protein [Nocardioides sp. R-C-SC26]
MSSDGKDFEDRLTRALGRSAAAAPTRVDGIARVAVERAGARSRRRAAGVVVVAAVAVLAALTPSLLAGGGPARSVVAGGSSSSSADARWRTVELAGIGAENGPEPESIEVEVPDEWVALNPGECDRIAGVVLGPPDVGCDGPSLSLFVGANFDMCCPPGLVSRDGEPTDGGYVYVGDQSTLFVDNADRDVARRILASARPAGTLAVGVGRWGEQQVYPGGVGGYGVEDPTTIVAEVPADARVSVREAGPASASRDWWSAVAVADGWRAVWFGLGRRVEITGPSRAVVDVVASTLRTVSASDSDRRWQRVQRDGISVELPLSWTSPPDCTDSRPGPPPTFGAAGGECQEVPGAFFYADVSAVSFAYGRGVSECESDGWCVLGLVGDGAVFARGLTRAQAVRLDASVEAAP